MTSRKKALVLSITLLAVCLTSYSVGAQGLIKTIEAQINSNIKLIHNGSPANLVEGQPIITYNDRTYLPLRAVSELVGADVNWDEATETITIDTKTGISLRSHPIVGTWKADDRANSLMKVTADGKLYHNGQYVATVEILADNKVKIVSNRKDITQIEQIISYELNGDKLKWGPNLEQTFVRLADVMNTSYKLEGEAVVLVNGQYQKEVAPGSASKITTMIWGQPVVGDLNGDGKEDAAVILTHSGGGSGTFYYVAAALKSSEGEQYLGTNAVLLGDRIAPQNISIGEGTITVNYAERKPGEPMTAQPSVGVSKYLRIEDATLTEISVGR